MVRPARIAAVVFLALICSWPIATGAAEVPPRAMDLVRLIQPLGVSGFEQDVRDVVKAALPPWAKPRVDEAGNLIVTIGQGSPHTLVVASIDEDGYFVSGITEDGYLRVQRMTSGGAHRLFDQFFYGQPILVRTTAGKLVAGVTGAASSHLMRGVQGTFPARGLDDLYVDVGARSKAEVGALGIQVLDPVKLRERGVALARGTVAGVAAQARANGLAILSLVAGLDKPPATQGTVTLAWVAMGLFGDRGMARLAEQVSPDRVIVAGRSAVGRLDSAVSGDPRGAIGKLGGGVMVAEADTATADAVKAAGASVQTGPGLKPPAAFAARQVQVVSLPVLFPQTPVETVDVSDVEDLAKAMAGLARMPVPADRPGVALIASAGPQKAAPAGATLPAAGVLTTLGTLADTYGVSGHEALVREAVASALPKWAKPEVDERGNLTVNFGHGGRELVFVAHTDELGYELTAIGEDGTATVRKRGGFFDSGVEAHPLLVHTAGGQVPAVVAPRIGYLQGADWQPRPADVFLYFGTTSRSETEALGVAVGATATVRKQFTRLAGSRATARAIDDRAGCAVLLEALKRIDPAVVGNRVTFAWVVGEETGLEGSGFLARRQHPAFVFPVDTFVSSDTPLDNKRVANIPLGTGAVLRAIDNSSMTPADVLAKIRSMAATAAIPVSVGTTNGGNDGSTFHRYGTIVVPISWPGRYSHSPVEVVDGGDLDALTRLVVLLANRF